MHSIKLISSWPCDTLSTYPYFNEEFKMKTDAIDLQLGSIISQRGKLISFHSRKLTDTQKRLYRNGNRTPKHC